jgi:hypothetical protein
MQRENTKKMVVEQVPPAYKYPTSGRVGFGVFRGKGQAVDERLALIIVMSPGSCWWSRPQKSHPEL